MTTKVSVPGKIILSGEHSVVYGYPALLAASSLRLNLEIAKGQKQKTSRYADYAFKKAFNSFRVKNQDSYSFNISSKIPVGSGMGSSAALAVGMSSAASILSRNSLDLEEINKVAYEIEKKQHGTPSGGDNTIITYGGFVWYRKEAENLKVFSKIKPKQAMPKFFIINSGKPRETTGEMVSFVREKCNRNPKKIRRIFEQMESCTKGFLKFILNETKIDLSQLIATNQRLLEELEVCSLETRHLVSELEKNGASVKISGAGGKTKGSGILLVYPKDIKKLQNFAKSKKLDMISVSLGGKGVQIKAK